ncbi:M20 family metallo-hydrolase [Desulfonatronovibrio magnus]|uniref:M20 family metallo-hydrolase n=1 Tax=Desulfonatronovibrio magnus TaxID=698827 RepID=UPI0005EB4119|nr:M20 family metallo-hydrolase [Desulfonatronovibrio magnus]RQD65374.1 MAG: Zn-dependent hydrolase [Desulfonatronovibrio sp. MSAO_Bac4]
MKISGQQIFDILEEAATFSLPGPGVTRVLGSPQHKALLPKLKQWMQQAGLETRLDAAGNLIGRYPIEGLSKKTLILGSHQDTVVQGGKYDGMLGIVVPLVALAELNAQKAVLPCNVELIAFSDEEGVRFPSTLTGSSPLAGKFDMRNLQLKDKDGVTLEQALLDIGGNPEQIPALARNPEDMAGYLEVHIEQGPVLENEDLPVGIVSAITGIERHSVIVHGEAGHAGTIPMNMRKDALVGAARIVSTVDQTCKMTDSLVGVVGSLSVSPNAVNVVPALVNLTIELRSPDSKLRARSREQIFATIQEHAKELNLGLEHQMTYAQDGVECSPKIQKGLARAFSSFGISPRYLFSGAGHDGLAMSYLTDVGMLFVRCKKGVSHHPDEAITMDDAETAARIVKEFLLSCNADG